MDDAPEPRCGTGRHCRTDGHGATGWDGPWAWPTKRPQSARERRVAPHVPPRRPLVVPASVSYSGLAHAFPVTLAHRARSPVEAHSRPLVFGPSLARAFALAVAASSRRGLARAWADPIRTGSIGCRSQCRICLSRWSGTTAAIARGRLSDNHQRTCEPALRTPQSRVVHARPHRSPAYIRPSPSHLVGAGR